MYKPYPLALRAVLFYKNTEVALHTQAVSVFFLLNIPLNNIRPRRLSGCNNSAYTPRKTCSRQEDTCKTCARWFYTLCKNRRAKRSRRKEVRRTSIILIWFSYLSASFVFLFCRQTTRRLARETRSRFNAYIISQISPKFVSVFRVFTRNLRLFSRGLRLVLYFRRKNGIKKRFSFHRISPTKRIAFFILL